jgi:MFS family permease
MSQGLTKSFGGLVCARFFIGMFEAGFTPGFLYLFSMYYSRYQLQKRLSLMFASGIIAGAFSGVRMARSAV